MAARLDVDEDRSPLATPDDIRRARERLFSALLTWWERPLAPEEEIDRGSVAETMRSLLRDSMKGALKTGRLTKRPSRTRV